MSNLTRIRAGWRPTILDKARTCETLEELRGFRDQAMRGGHATSGEIEELTRMVVAKERDR